jgi:hypothetical protein
MSRIVRVAITTIALVLLGVATTLATISGAIDAVDWARRTFGVLPVYLTAAFLAGAVITHGVHRGMAGRK